MYAINFREGGTRGARLIFDKISLQRLTPLEPTVIDVTPRFAPERLRVERFIQDIYRRNYGADIAVTYPVLMSMRDDAGQILAAAGFRPAADEGLFLEQYTREPIEDVLSRVMARPVARSGIAEIGNLASAGKGASVFLFAAIASYLLNQGIEYAAVTGTDQLCRRFAAMGLNPHIVCDANIDKLKSEQKSWGTYYDAHPRVLCGSLEDSMCRLNKKLGATYQENGVTLFPRLHHRGTTCA